MQEDLILLFAGAILGFLSALLIELIKSRLEKHRSMQERAMESIEEREKEVKEFLSTGAKKKIAPASLTLVKTNHPFPFFQRIQTGDSTRLDLSENERLDNIQNSAKSTLEKFLLSQTQIIGRQADCEIRLLDSAVSRIHAMIRYEDGDYVIYDLSSRSGSYVNGTKVKKDGIVLRSGDYLQIGDSAFVFDGYPDTRKAPDEEKKKEALITKPPRSSSRNKSKKS
jgi:hypothetical protein